MDQARRDRKLRMEREKQKIERKVREEIQREKRREKQIKNKIILENKVSFNLIYDLNIDSLCFCFKNFWTLSFVNVYPLPNRVAVAMLVLNFYVSASVHNECRSNYT